MKRPSPSGARSAGPSLKKIADEGITAVFLDESAFYTLPSVVRTWAPVGQTPLLPPALRYEHLSAISAVTPQGKLYLMTKEQSLQAPDVIVFLQHLMRVIPGKLLLLWDRGSIHRAHLTKDFLLRHAHRIEVEWLPAYAPELNPDEGVWRYLKYVELRNLGCSGIPNLRQAVVQAAQRLRGRPSIIKSFFRLATLIL